MLLAKVIELATTLEAADFVARFPEAVLLPLEGTFEVEASGRVRTAPTPRTPRPRLRETTDDDSSLETFSEASPPETLLGALGKPPPPPPPSGSLPLGTGVAHALVLVKTSRNPYLHMITLGRSRNNDLVVDHHTVSKFHAHFTKQGDAWTVHDHGSTNGTFLGSRKVTADGAPLACGDLVTVGARLVFRFLTPRGLHALLGAQAGAS